MVIESNYERERVNCDGIIRHTNHRNRALAVITKTTNALGVANALTWRIRCYSPITKMKTPTTTGTDLLNTIRSDGFELPSLENSPKKE